MTEEFLCARCARHTRTCCQDTEIHVTLGDLRRIAPHAAVNDISEFRAPRHPVYDQSLEDPVWHQSVFRADGTRRVLKQQPDGDCVFLGSEGCRLPAEARPLVCRLYPFDYSSEGIHRQLASGCPVELLRPGQRLLEVLNMDIGEARRLHSQLYDEIRETGPECESNGPAQTTSGQDVSFSSAATDSAPSTDERAVHENRPHLRSA